MSMFKAIKSGDANEVMRLLNTDPSLLEDAVWGLRWTPLIYAASDGQLEIVKLLIGKGADIHATTPQDQTALHWAAISEHEEVVAYLLDKSAQPSYQSDWGHTPLMYAIGKRPRMALRLLEHMGGQGLEAKCLVFGHTALHRAVYQGLTELVAILLNHGARADTRNKDGRSALQTAVDRGHVDVLKLLVDHIVDHLGPQALHEVDPIRGSLLHIALCAVGNRSEEMVMHLLSKGPWPTVRDEYGETALMFGARRGSITVLRRLLDQMAGQGLNDRSSDGKTALHYAVLHDGHDNVRALLLAGADPTIVDDLQTTPRMLAQQGTVYRRSAKVFKWWDGGVACALVLHRARALHNAYATHQEAPTRPVPGYLKARAEAGLALPQVEVVEEQEDGAGWEGGKKRTRAATRTYAAGIHHDLPSMMEFVVGELSEELFTELLQGFSDWRSEG